MLRALGVAVLLVALSVPVAGTPSASPEVVAVYPNPVADDDAGEFVAIRVPEATTLSAYALDDGEDRVGLPRVRPGTVVVSTHPNLTGRLVDRPVRRISDDLRLSNAGERLRLVRGTETIDAVAYGQAPEGSVYGPDADRPWRPLGATDRPVVTAAAGTVEAFVLPDAGGFPAAELATADRRILLAGYTLTSADVADALVRARRRGVAVRVLVEGGPVGGFSQREARHLDRLVEAGIDVRLVGGAHARVRYHHAWSRKPDAVRPRFACQNK